jgi:polyisoprenoid-binding protein YceI
MNMLLSKISFRMISLTMALVLVAACASAPTPAPIPADTPAPVATASAAAATTAPGAAAPTTAAAASGSSEAKYVLVPANSEASYSIREQLAQRNFPNDAIGKTNAISGSVTVNADGTIDTAASQFTVDVSTLKSDQSMRDGYVSRSILQTNKYPLVTFVPTQATGLPATLPQSGNVSFQLAGNLTIRDVTKPVTWDVTGTVSSGEATGVATTNFTFEDFNLSTPHVSVVLSVVDKITLNVSVDLKPAGGQ